jgi:hypothetical protein
VTESEAQEARLAEFVRFGLGPVHARWHEAQQGASPVEAMWTLGVLLEAGAWICLGTEVGYFPPNKALSILEMSVGRQAKQVLVSGDRDRIVGNRWTESLFSGNLEQALSVRSFRREPQDIRLLSEFGTILLLVWGGEEDLLVHRVLSAFLLDGDAVWDREIQRTAQLLAMVTRGQHDPAGQEAWRACAGGEAWIADGLIRLLVQLDAIETWAASARSGWGMPAEESLAQDEEALGDVDEDSTRIEDTGRVLVRAAGRVMRWRLEPSDRRVRERLANVASLLDAPRLMRALTESNESPWPGGFRIALTEALSRWEQMSAQMLTA